MLVTIANCPIEFVFQCPQLWTGLLATADWRVRHCQVCERDVHLCTTIDELQAHAAAGHCVAVDRWGIEQAAQDRKARQREHIRRRQRERDTTPEWIGYVLPTEGYASPRPDFDPPLPEDVSPRRPAEPE